ncbi:lysophospholipid acyltransferase family protein [Kineosporia sp. NBRC 101731]|uniref:lysophospholipid acyltransferase family protein n=1 Tax=Kineosporia sp. NBRC 101731 TaxID=3032199 RepID=UPI00249FAF5A|nr:lysophospholipid acyltransferase family protein [Kineosporia sp. NBRC 101731]GLY32180.1 hypothetical protein Kisp02_55450 [Kineosporia sp. NBRC 101731]
MTGQNSPSTGDDARPTIPRASSWVRAVGWDQLLRLLCGGVGVGGTIPQGPAIVIANHSSHADTAALIAVLGHRGSVLVVAGGDYWNGWRGRLARDVVGILPIQRDGGFEALLDAAGAHLAQGGTVVIFPEGTRTTDGSLGRFRSGAVRLAAATGAPIVPTAVHGTRELFGKNNLPRLNSTRTAPLGVRFGEPVTVSPTASTGDTSDDLRKSVEALLEAGPAPVSPSPMWEWARLNLRGRNGMAWTFGWAFAEGLFWPIVAETGTIPVALAHGRRSVPAVVAAAAGSVGGVAANYALARAGVRVPWPLTTPSMHATAREQLSTDVGGALREQRGNGIPVKVYARTAGEQSINPGTFITAAALARSSRIIPVGLAAAAVGEIAQRRLKVSYGGVLALSGVGLAVGLELVVRSWKQHR